MPEAWASLAVLTAINVTFFAYLGTKIDAQGEGPSGWIDPLSARIDAQGAPRRAHRRPSARRVTDHYAP
jgi:hypothetical protein